jgi:hypothetical protein
MRNINVPENQIEWRPNVRGRLMRILAFSVMALGGCATTDSMETMQGLVEKLGGEYPGLPKNGKIIDCAEGSTESEARQEAENTNRKLLGQNAQPEGIEAAETGNGWVVCVKSGTHEDTSTNQMTSRTPTRSTAAKPERPVPAKKISQDSGSNSGNEKPASQQEAINRLIKGNKPYFRSCYEKVLKNDSEAGGKIHVKAQIRPDGSVEKVTLYNISSVGPFMAMCVRNNISGWKLPPSGKGSEIKFPLVFTTGTDK